MHVCVLMFQCIITKFMNTALNLIKLLFFFVNEECIYALIFS